VKDLLARTRAGQFAENKGQLETIITRYYREFIDSGEVRYLANDALQEYSYCTIAAKFSAILNNVAASR
jgi:hypothetical protein